MFKSRTIRGMIAATMVAVTAAASAAGAAAHEGREAGEFDFVVGFLNEPAYEGEPNGVSIRISKRSGATGTHGALINEVIAPDGRFSYTFEHEQEGNTVIVHVHPMDFKSTVVVGHDGAAGEQTVTITSSGLAPDLVSIQAGSTVTWVNETAAGVSLMEGEIPPEEPVQVPVTGHAGDLAVEVTHVPTGTSKEFSLRETSGEPGHYVANFIPTATGVYSFRVTGDIEGAHVDETFTASPDTFSEVAPAREVQFPLQFGSAREVDGVVRSLQTEVDQASGDASAARNMGIVGVAVGVVGLAAGGAGLAVALRKRSVK